MKLVFPFFLFLSFHVQSVSQREFDTEVLNKKLSGDLDQQVIFEYSVGPYLLDLNQDQIKEKIILSRRNGYDWVELRTDAHLLLFKFKFETQGERSGVFKIVRAPLNKDFTTLLFYFDEGISGGGNQQSLSRLYFLTIDNQQYPKRMVMTRGPSVEMEKTLFDKQYLHRKFDSEFIDGNNDGIHELLLSSGNLKKVIKLNQKTLQWFEI